MKPATTAQALMEQVKKEIADKKKPADKKKEFINKTKVKSMKQTLESALRPLPRKRN